MPLYEQLVIKGTPPKHKLYVEYEYVKRKIKTLFYLYL